MMSRILRTGSPIDKDFTERRFKKFETRDADILLVSRLLEFPEDSGAGFQFKASTPFPRRVMLAIDAWFKKVSLPVNSTCSVFLP